MYARLVYPRARTVVYNGHVAYQREYTVDIHSESFDTEQQKMKHVFDNYYDNLYQAVETMRIESQKLAYMDAKLSEDRASTAATAQLATSVNQEESKTNNSVKTPETSQENQNASVVADEETTAAAESDPSDCTESTSNNVSSAGASQTSTPSARPEDPTKNMSVSAANKLLLDQMFFDLREKMPKGAFIISLAEPYIRSKGSTWLEYCIALHTCGKKDVTPEQYKQISSNTKYILLALALACFAVYEQYQSLKKLKAEVDTLQRAYDKALLQQKQDSLLINQITEKLQAITQLKTNYENALEELNNAIKELDEQEKGYIQYFLTNFIYSNVTNEINSNFETRDHLQQTRGSESLAYRDMARIGSTQGTIIHFEDLIKKLKGDIEGINIRLKEVKETTDKRNSIVHDTGEKLTTKKEILNNRYGGVFFTPAPKETAEEQQDYTHNLSRME